MKSYKYIEKLVVMQHPDSKDLIRLMIEHDGQQTYGLQRSIVNKGKVRHFYNKKLWHSAYNVKLELARRISDYEDKGFDVMTEISLQHNNIGTIPEFFYSKKSINAGDKAVSIEPTDVPIFVDCSFHKLSIRDLRYNTEIVDEDLIAFFNALRKTIEFLPFTMVSVWSKSEIKVLMLDYHSKPKPKHGFNYLAKMATTDPMVFVVTDCTVQNSVISNDTLSESCAVLSNDSLTYHLSSKWMSANVFLEKHPHMTSFKVYCMDSGVYREVLTDVKLNEVDRSCNAEILFTHVENQISNVTFVRSLGFHVTISNEKVFYLHN
ncbi:hypothetical protein [Shewanella frigidimarina]|uniref:hypothetical protein n=1 Tax=Shewanella frigidimarina TaxID=56812 RepID=UPI003D7B7539